jgi:hypothetical protein
MMMDCRQVAQLLPLWVGQDLPDAASSTDVARHLQSCPDCELRSRELQSSLDVLQASSVEAFPAASGRPGMVPRLMTRLSDWDRQQRRERFNGWIPAGVMSLAVALMVAVSLPSIQREFFGGSYTDWNTTNLFESEPAFTIDSIQGDNRPPRRPPFGTAVKFPSERKFSSEQW